MSKSPERVSGEGTDSAAGVRGALDALVLGALVDLFQAYDVALAPLPRPVARRTAALPGERNLA